MYDTIIYDVDGTLIDTEQAVLGSLQKMLLTDYSQSYEREDLVFVLGIPGASALPQLGIKDIDKANERWNEYMKDFYASIKVFDGMLDVITKLHNRRVPQGIVTSKTKQELQDDFVPFGLMDYLSYAVCADDTSKHKPYPEPLLKFIQVSGTDPKRAIYIGDTIYDYECARDAGIDFGLALWGCKNQVGIDAAYRLEQPQDILNLLNKTR
ncbi:HAD family hydrolase [Paenibacillus sp. UMB4589-SE434]|uniref:HAD family hydrolase n=1 Tax=Paenibacillus sp. UMB4589-SE434 TaxID=3046314 RepID=UPI002550A494|nr:HAD family hydrolase [Paenibacillus sp. UMB4589-SE434]MDK8183269.1 HAD family hydrolase [Paenibacillus sp. UMB4589-SE434]